MNNILKKENRIVLIVGIFCLIFIGTIINYTFSFFAVEQTNSSIIAGEAESMKLDLTVVEKSSTNNGKLIPQLDEYITSAVIGRNGSCIDDNNNTVCQVYKITLKNSGSSSVYVNGEVVIDNKNNPNLKWAILNNTDTDVLTAPVLNGNIKTPEETVLTSNELFTAGQTKNYFIVVWISEKGQTQIDSGNFTGVVNFNNTEGNDIVKLTSGEVLQKLNLSVASGTPDFSKTSCSSGCEEATVGVYEAEDDLGTSYYFRGDVTNNYVKFAQDSEGNDMYWRIIRINGDGSVRMVYDGTTAKLNDDPYEKHIRGAFLSGDDDTIFEIGYMYGEYNRDTRLFANTHDSYLKQALDSWYVTNIIDTGYSEYVADAIYCNDREIISSSVISSVSNEDVNNVNNNKLLVAKEKGKIIPLEDTLENIEVKFAGYERLIENSEPTLKCNQQNDRFTVELDIGNKALTYPIAGLTKDELIMLGITGATYLYSGSMEYFTMTTERFTGNIVAPIVDMEEHVGLFMFTARDKLYDTNVLVTARFVISIDSDFIIYDSETANGSREFPFLVG